MVVYNKLLSELRAEVSELIKKLSSNSSDIGDWKVIKIYEYRMAGKSDPYDFDKVHSDREKIRKKINDLKEKIKEIEDELDS